ncbi:CASP-like protein 4A2 [Miscanthus floridulus]|uniref:CASP-like protein 4A2 n=1 Tax=Miscanthus floridulus TaxID=154761 RepID=UPI0034574ABF
MWDHALDPATPLSATASLSPPSSHTPPSSQAHRRSRLHSAASTQGRLRPTPPPRRRKPAPLCRLHHRERPCGPLRRRAAPSSPDHDAVAPPQPSLLAPPQTPTCLRRSKWPPSAGRSPPRRAAARLLPSLLPPAAPLPVGQLVAGPLLPPADPLLPSGCSCRNLNAFIVLQFMSAWNNENFQSLRMAKDYGRTL